MFKSSFQCGLKKYMPEHADHGFMGGKSGNQKKAK